MLIGNEVHLTLQSVSEDHKSATVNTAKIENGVSGFIVRHFNSEHSAIIANAVVKNYNEHNKTLTLGLSKYTGLRNNSLPSGAWEPKAGDEAVLAFGYARALLIAPQESIWYKISSGVKALEWVHPDTFATYLSYLGHPTPLKDDISGFCTVVNAGLLYIYAQNALFTLDCQSFALLQITPAAYDRTGSKLPFYSRVEEIREAWWGEGSSPLETYDPYYMELIVENNPTSKMLYEYIKNNDSNITQLLEEFEIN